MNIFQYLFLLLNNTFQTFTGARPPAVLEKVQPNIIVIMVDDMGWNDFGFHGSNEIPTPNIDALAYNGVILNRHYTMPTCTPSRAAFLTGRHPVRMGLQGFPINVAEPRGIPLREKLLPEYLQKLGYTTRLVGKWHLGYYTEMHTPTRRGFDSFVGYYGGYVKYFQHTVTKDKHTGIDFHSDTPKEIEEYNNDRYLTDFITDKSEEIIKNHNKEKPLYLHISHLAGHASIGEDPIEVRNLTEVNDTLGYIPDLNRRKYAGIATAMDESVGKVVKTLNDAKMLNNSIIVFMSDNGAPTAEAPYTNYGSNYPLRGIKATLFEGGIRPAAFVYSPLIKKPSRVSEEFMHVTDWFPTLLNLAGGNVAELEGIDGVDQWATINEDKKSKRESVFLNIDEVVGPEGAIFGNYKLLRGVPEIYSKHYGQDGNKYSPKSYDVTGVISSMAGKAIRDFVKPTFGEERKIMDLRKKATIKCQGKDNEPDCKESCLFDIVKDPCETTDVSDKHPEMIVSISALIEGFQSVLVNQTNTYIDPRGYPEHFNGYWMPWLDHEYTPPRDRNKSVIWSVSVFCEGFPVDDPRNCL